MSQLLEAKRSLDGLLSSVADLYNSVIMQNEEIESGNATIRDKLAEERGFEETLVSDEDDCDKAFRRKQADLVSGISDDIDELKSIANPNVWDNQTAAAAGSGRGPVTKTADNGYQARADPGYTA